MKQMLLDESELPAGFSVVFEDVPYRDHEPPNTGSEACDLSETIGGFEPDAVARAYSGTVDGVDFTIAVHVLVRPEKDATTYYDNMLDVPAKCPSWHSAETGKTYKLDYLVTPDLGVGSLAIVRTSEPGDRFADVTWFAHIGSAVLAVRNTGTGGADDQLPPEDLVRRQVEKIRAQLAG